MKLVYRYYRLLAFFAVLVCTLLALPVDCQNQPTFKGEVIPLSTFGKASVGLKTQVVTRVSLPIQVSVPGKIEAIPNREFNQHAPLSGRISKVETGLGEFVRQGQVLVVVESPEMNQLAAQLLQNKLTTESEYATQKTLFDDEVRQWQAKRDLAHANYERLKKLQEDRIAAQKDVVQALADFKVAETRLSTAKQNRELTLSTLKKKIALTDMPIKQRLRMLGVDKQHLGEMVDKQETLERVPVTSMRAGLITSMSASAGQSIDPSVTLFRVSDLSRVWATANVYEDDMSRIRLGEKVTIKVHAISEPLYGKITYIGNQVDSATRTLPVRAEVANADLKLKPDMFAELLIDTSNPAPMIVLPHDAIVHRLGHSIVFVETPQGYQPVEVKLGRNLGDDVEIVDGLKVGQSVVIRGAFQLGAELVRIQGGNELFHSPTEGDEIGHGEHNTDALNLNVQTIVLLLLASFLLGLCISAFFLMQGRSTRLTLKVEHTPPVEGADTQENESPIAKSRSPGQKES